MTVSAKCDWCTQPLGDGLTYCSTCFNDRDRKELDETKRQLVKANARIRQLEKAMREAVRGLSRGFTPRPTTPEEEQQNELEGDGSSV